MFTPRDAICDDCKEGYTKKGARQHRCTKCQRKARTRQVAESLQRMIANGTLGKHRSHEGGRYPFYWEWERD